MHIPIELARDASCTVALQIRYGSKCYTKQATGKDLNESQTKVRANSSACDHAGRHEHHVSLTMHANGESARRMYVCLASECVIQSIDKSH